MSSTFTPIGGLLGSLSMLRAEQADSIVHLRLARPDKRNAISDALIAEIHTAFVNLPESTRVVM